MQPANLLSTGFARSPVGPLFLVDSKGGLPASCLPASLRIRGVRARCASPTGRRPDADPSLLPFLQVHHSTKGGSSVLKHISSSMHRHCSAPPSSDSELQLLTQLYMTLLRALRRQYLEDLLEMQALCTLLCGIHSSAQAQVRNIRKHCASCCSLVCQNSLKGFKISRPTTSKHQPQPSGTVLESILYACLGRAARPIPRHNDCRVTLVINACHGSGALPLMDNCSMTVPGHAS